MLKAKQKMYDKNPHAPARKCYRSWSGVVDCGKGIKSKFSKSLALFGDSGSFIF